MKKVLFSTNVPSPYRVDFFNELGKYCDLTVCFERQTASDRDGKWKGKAPENFKAVQLDLKPYKEDRSKGNALKNYIKENQFDIVILTNYVSPATMSAISWCKRHKKPYYIEYDGGFNKKDCFPISVLKKYLLCSAAGHFTTCEEHKKYLLSIGIKEDKIFKYPFTSLREEDLQNASVLSYDEKNALKQSLDMSENKIVITVGRFTYGGGYGKGYDTLLEAALSMRDVGIYIIGGEPTEEFIEMKNKLQLENVHFIGFKSKIELAEYYKAADAFALLTRGDIWGLVINEAMAYSLPIVTTDKCIAGLELVENGENGYIVPVGNADVTAEKINAILCDEALSVKMGHESRRRIEGYTIEKMAERHMEIFKQITGESD